jgi:hypothetical protein
MKWNRNHVFQAAAGDGGGGGGSEAAATASAADAAAAAAAAQQGGQGADPATLLQQGAGGTDWLPEKFRVAKEDGSIDTEASSRKLAASYAELEKTRPTGTVPKTAEEYAPEGLPEGIKFDEIKADPLYQGFLKGAHGKGLTNDQVSYVLGEYFKLAPGLVDANQQLSVADAKTELGKVWTDDAAMTQNLRQATRAVNGFGVEGDVPGATARLMAKYGNDPDFLAFAAAVGKEMAEDTPIVDGSQQAQDWEAQIAAIKADPGYTDANHPQHQVLLRKMSDLYQKRYGTKAPQVGSI